MFCITYNKMHNTAKTHSMRVLKKVQRTHTHSTWHRVVKCCLAIYFIFINLLISVALLPVFDFCLFSLKFFAFLVAFVRIAHQYENGPNNNGFWICCCLGVFLPFVCAFECVCFTAFLHSFICCHERKKKYRHQFALMPDVCT